MPLQKELKLFIKRIALVNEALTEVVESNDLINVEVAYALPDEQEIIQLKVKPDTNIKAIILQSGILDRFPEIDLDISKIGIFSKLAKYTDTLHDGDRIEIYRPLIADPKEVRKQRALKKAQADKKQ